MAGHQSDSWRRRLAEAVPEAHIAALRQLESRRQAREEFIARVEGAANQLLDGYDRVITGFRDGLTHAHVRAVDTTSGSRCSSTTIGGALATTSERAAVSSPRLQTPQRHSHLSDACDGSRAMIGSSLGLMSSLSECCTYSLVSPSVATEEKWSPLSSITHAPSPSFAAVSPAGPPSRIAVRGLEGQPLASSSLCSSKFRSPPRALLKATHLRFCENLLRLCLFAWRTFRMGELAAAG